MFSETRFDIFKRRRCGQRIHLLKREKVFSPKTGPTAGERSRGKTGDLESEPRSKDLYFQRKRHYQARISISLNNGD